MVDTFGMAGMIVFAILVLAAIYLFIRLTGKPSRDEGENDEDEPSAVKKSHEISDREFVDSYTGPMLEDALDSLDAAVDSINSGLDYYNRSVWEAAGEEFHTAAKGIDDASARLKEVVAMVEDQGSSPSLQAKARIEECRKLRAMTIRMEEACDARVEGKGDEAKAAAGVMPELERLASSFKK